MTWKRFPHHWPFVWGIRIHRWPVVPIKKPVMRSLDAFMVVRLNKCLKNNRVVGDLGHHDMWHCNDTHQLPGWVIMMLTDGMVPIRSHAISKHPDNYALSPHRRAMVRIGSLQWRHNECDGVSNHQPHDCLHNCLFMAQIKENIKAPRHWPL